MSNVPLVDLGAQAREIDEDIQAGFARVLSKTAFIMGPDVKSFEEEYAAYTGAAHCMGCGSGTDAIELMVRAAGLGAGDEVIIPANTFIATAIGVMRAGAKPTLVDSDAKYHLMDPSKLAESCTDNTRAILPVHLYGQLAPMQPILQFAKERDLIVLEDAAQSQGATQNQKHAGSFGAAAAISFYPGKNLGAYGDGGAVTTQDEKLAGHIRHLRNYGSEQKYHHPEFGFNSRLDTLQAVVLRAKLQRLDGWNQKRRDAAAYYDELLAGVDGVALPSTLPGNEHVWHLYVIRVANRDKVLSGLHENGIGAGIHYPTPIHLHGAMSELGYQEGDFPEAERACNEILTLPIFPHITREQQERSVAALKESLS